MQKLGPALELLLYSSNISKVEADNHYFPPINCIVSPMYCTKEVATNMKCPGKSSGPCTMLRPFPYNTSLSFEGHSPVKVGEENNPLNPITCLPGNTPKVRRTFLGDLSSGFFDSNSKQLSTRIYLCHCCNVRACGI